MGRKGFGNLGSDPVEGVKTGHRVLENDAYLAAPQTAQLFITFPQQFFSLEFGASKHVESMIQKAHRRFHRHGFSTSGLPKDSKTLSRIYREGNSLHQLHPLMPTCAEQDMEIL